MSFNSEDKLNFYKIKIDKYREKIEELEGGSFGGGTKMFVFKGTDMQKITDSIGTKESPKDINEDSILEIIKNNSFIIDLDSNEASLVKSTLKTLKSTVSCNLSNSIDVIIKKLRDGVDKDEVRKYIIDRVRELPDEIIKLPVKFQLTNALYRDIVKSIFDKYPTSGLNSYFIIKFRGKLDKKTVKTIIEVNPTTIPDEQLNPITVTQ